ncbi:iron ABC transporter permease [Nocardioides sp. GY 10127]|uniref:FecCD family ABC transporter permease n=1 Tax=Nocardioides sp. GY 10127 TaxID=2569762 RepID=UPI0010A8C3B2|nr:iron ABC transporter permease [Nocardioides sp. GY 10127]TIC86400.1 iron ABC transporter permease [Nocardioides sp. GY 10127]
MRGTLTPRLWATTLGAALAAGVLLVAGILAGSSDLGVGDVLHTLFVGGDRTDYFIVFELRMPRVAAAVLVGASLGMAGALTQAFSRNPLATPDILGVTSGAAAGAVATIVLGGGAYAVGAGLLGFGLPVVACAGGLLTAALVYGLSWRSGVDSYRLILIGIGVTAALTGVVNYLVVRAQLTQAAAATQWLVGSLSGVSWTSVWPVAVTLLVVAPLALGQTRALEVGQLGDDVSVGLGVSLQRHRLVVLACAVVLTSVAVSAAGPIEFVAFVAPQVARRLAGSSRPPLVASALVGAALVTAADIVGRALMPWPVPVGIVTAVVGAPYLIWLLTRRSSAERTASA